MAIAPGKCRQAKLAGIKDMLYKLQSTVDRLSLLVEVNQSRHASMISQTRWLALAGVGMDVWKSVDVDAYIDEERNAWG